MEEEKMKEVKRYDVPLYSYDLVSQIREIPNGDFVPYKDYEYLRAQLSEAQREIERLKKHACEYSAVDNAIINPCGFVMKLLEKFEQAEAENAALRERLQRIEDMVIWIANKK